MLGVRLGSSTGKKTQAASPLQETEIPRQPRGPLMSQGTPSSWTVSLSSHLPSKILHGSA